MAQSFVKELVKTLLTLVLAAASLMLAGPMAILGLIALAGGLETPSYVAGAILGLFFIANATLIWAAAAVWLAWCDGRIKTWRFSLGRMLVAVTLAALYMTLVAKLMAYM